MITWRDGFNPLEPKNIRGVIPKWCDFGLGRYVTEDDDGEPPSVSIRGNPKYRAPELAEKLDTYSKWKEGFRSGSPPRTFPQDSSPPYVDYKDSIMS